MRIDLNVIYSVDKFKFKNFTSLAKDEIILVWQWRNSDIVRRYMYNSDLISLESHINFVEKLRTQSNCAYWLVEYNGQNIGVMNVTSIDSINEVADIGFYQSPEISGQGFKLLKASYDLFFNHLKFKCLHAFVNEKNYESLLLSEYLGCVFEKSKVLNEERYLISTNLTKEVYNKREKSLSGFIEYIKNKNK